MMRECLYERVIKYKKIKKNIITSQIVLAVNILFYIFSQLASSNAFSLSIIKYLLSIFANPTQ